MRELMEWKWIKSFLIFVFIVLNCFLGYKVYQRNQAVTVNTESIESIQSILKARNINCDFDLSKVEARGYMRKISMSNNENIDTSIIDLWLSTCLESQPMPDDELSSE